jgi:hypothetical protein
LAASIGLAAGVSLAGGRGFSFAAAFTCQQLVEPVEVVRGWEI